MVISASSAFSVQEDKTGTQYMFHLPELNGAFLLNEFRVLKKTRHFNLNIAYLSST